MKLNIGVGEVTCYAARSGIAQILLPFRQYSILLNVLWGLWYSYLCYWKTSQTLEYTENPLWYQTRHRLGCRKIQKTRKPNLSSLQFRDSPSILYCLPCMYYKPRRENCWLCGCLYSLIALYPPLACYKWYLGENASFLLLSPYPGLLELRHYQGTPFLLAATRGETHNPRSSLDNTKSQLLTERLGHHYT